MVVFPLTKNRTPWLHVSEFARQNQSGCGGIFYSYARWVYHQERRLLWYSEHVNPLTFFRLAGGLPYKITFGLWTCQIEFRCSYYEIYICLSCMILFEANCKWGFVPPKPFANFPTPPRLKNKTHRNRNSYYLSFRHGLRHDKYRRNEILVFFGGNSSKYNQRVRYSNNCVWAITSAVLRSCFTRAHLASITRLYPSLLSCY